MAGNQNSHENQIYLSQFTRSQLYDGPFMTNPLGHKALTGSSNAHRRILRAMGDDIDYFVYHDLRRTMATRMPELGIKEVVTSRLLNHSSEVGEMSKIYNRYTYKKERIAALLIWSDYVQNLVNGS